jgi:hypothetical protein
MQIKIKLFSIIFTNDDIEPIFKFYYLNPTQQTLKNRAASVALMS